MGNLYFSFEVRLPKALDTEIASAMRRKAIVSRNAYILQALLEQTEVDGLARKPTHTKEEDFKPESHKVPVVAFSMRLPVDLNETIQARMTRIGFESRNAYLIRACRLQVKRDQAAV